MAMTGLILFGAATYDAPYGYDYDSDYGSPYDQYYTTLYSGATQNWSMILPSGPGSNGQFLKTDGTGRTSWATVSSGSSAWAALTGDLTETQVIPWDGGIPGTKDTGISRLGAASLAIGNGTAGDYSGTLTAIQFNVISGLLDSFVSPFPSTATRTGALTVGFTFTVPQPITISQLGRLYVSGNTQNHGVNLWISTNTSTPIAGPYTILASSSSDSNGFKWVSITPVMLTPGNTYALALDEYAGGDTWKDEWIPSLQPTFSVTAAYSLTTGTYPSNLVAAGYMYDTAAMMYTAKASLTGGAPLQVSSLSAGLVTTNNIVLPTSGVLEWDASTGISYLSSGVLAIGNGAPQDTSGSLQLSSITLKTGGSLFVSSYIQDASATHAYFQSVANGTNAWVLFERNVGEVPFAIQGANSQTANLLDFRNGSAAVLLSVTAAGNLEWSTDTGISRIGAASLAIGNGTAGDTTGQVTAKTYTLSDFGSVPTSTSGGGTAGTVGQLVQHSGVLYFCSVTGVAGSATWNVITMTLSA
jgi:hypothetical protein